MKQLIKSKMHKNFNNVGLIGTVPDFVKLSLSFGFLARLIYFCFLKIFFGKFIFWSVFGSSRYFAFQNDCLNKFVYVNF